MTIERLLHRLPSLSQFIVTELPSQFSTQADYDGALAPFEPNISPALLRKHAGNVERCRRSRHEYGHRLSQLKKYGIRKKSSEYPVPIGIAGCETTFCISARSAGIVP